MKKKRKELIAIFTIILTIFTIGTTVMADDDEHEYENDKHENYQENDDDWRTNQQNEVTLNQQTEYWNIWSREPRNNPNNSLPISAPAEVKIIIDNTELNIYCIPQDGQLLVSSDAIAKVLGAQATFYPQSKISILTKGKHELIVKAGSNAVFENRIKAPMPIQSSSYEKSIYLPISVAANALGYRVSWDTKIQSLILQTI